MSVVTIQRSPSPINEPEEKDVVDTGDLIQTDTSCNKSSSASEDFLAIKGAALALPQVSRRRESLTGSQGALTTLEYDLQRIVGTLRSTDTLKLAVTLENQSSTPCSHSRYLCLIASNGHQGTEECALLGVDITPQGTTFGLVLPVIQDMTIQADGDGGFKVFNKDVEHFFKPASVQALWSAIQCVNQVLIVARKNNYFSTGFNHLWISYYKSRIRSSRQHINDWHRTDDSEEQPRSASPPREGEEADERARVEHEIRSNLREIMVSVELDDVTVLDLRKRLAEKMDCDLRPYKKFIGDSVLFILGQLDSPTQIFDHLYLGSKWNASNLEELEKNGVGYILNITREIDNFFMDVMKEYKNIRELDVESTDLLQHWEDTHRFINKARDDNSRVLVHCKMGVSRSASTVMAYAMKECGWSLEEAKQYVTAKRSCVYPNKGFMEQLHIYEGMLNARSNRSKFNEELKPMAPGGIIERRKRYSPSASGTQCDLVDGDFPEEPLDPQPINVEHELLRFKQVEPIRSVDMVSSEHIPAHLSGKSSTQSSLSKRSIATDPMDEGSPGSPMGFGCGGTDPRIAEVKIVRSDVAEPRIREEIPWRRSLRIKSEKSPEERSSQTNRESCSPPQESPSGSSATVSQTNSSGNVNRRLRADSSWIQSSEGEATCQDPARPHSVPSVSVQGEAPSFFLGGDIPGEESSTDCPFPATSDRPLSEQLPPSFDLRPGFVLEQSNRLQSLRVEPEEESDERQGDAIRRSHSFSGGNPNPLYVSEYIPLEPGIVAKTRESIEARERTSSDCGLVRESAEARERTTSECDPAGLQMDVPVARIVSDVLWWFCEPATQIPGNYVDSSSAASNVYRPSLNAPGDTVPVIRLSDADQLTQESSSDPQPSIDPQLAVMEQSRPVWRAKMHLLIRQVGDAFVRPDFSTPPGRRVRHIVTQVESSVDREPIRPVKQLVQKFREDSPVIRKKTQGHGSGPVRRASDYEQRRRCRRTVDKEKEKERGVRQSRFRGWGRGASGEGQGSRRHANSIYNTM